MTNNAHEEILARVHAGTLSLALLIGPARCGTTAVERLIYTRLGFDGNYNQPGLLGRKPEFSENPGKRQVYLWGRVLKKVQWLEQNDLERDFKVNPITLIIKETCNIVLPGLEHGLFEKACQSVVAVVRSPFLQMESRLGCILLRIEDAALSRFGIDAQKIDPRTFHIGGDPLIDPHTDFAHIDFSNQEHDLSPWVQHQRHMKKTRDYSSLGKGFVRLCNFHPLFEDPNAQLLIWSKYMQEHPSLLDQGTIDKYIGTKLEDIAQLPWALALALFEWDISWTPFDVMFHIMSQGQKAKMMVCDFSDVQSDAGVAVVGHSEEALIHTTARAGTYDFDLCSDGEEWDQWYLKSCDWDAMQPTEDILPQRRGPAPPEHFPAEVSGLFPKCCAAYLHARSHAGFVQPRNSLSEEELLSHVDCTYAYVSTQSAATRGKIRSLNPTLASYFDAIDSSEEVVGARRV